MDEIVNKLIERHLNFNYFLEEFEILLIDENNFDFLQTNMPVFLNTQYWLFWNYLTIHICNITDKISTGTNENLTIRLIINYAENNNFSNIEKIKEEFLKIESNITPFRNARSKAFAHYDLKTFVKNKKTINLEYEKLTIISNSIGEIINLYQEETKQTRSIFGFRDNKGAKKAMRFLNKGFEKIKEDLENYRNN